MSKSIKNKTEKGPLKYPVIMKPSEFKPSVEIKNIGGSQMVFEPVNVVERIHQEWYPLFLEMGLNFNTRLKKIFLTCYAAGLDPRPLPEEIFDAFSMAVSNIKVVIVAQDPYPQIDVETGRPVACGYSFATNSKKTPPSLERIKDAIKKEFGQIVTTDPEHPNSLRGWIDQGIFLLNNTPIYFGKGSLGYSQANEKLEDAKTIPKDFWMGVTEQICKYILFKNKGVRFLLVGSEAHYLRQHVTKAVCTSHPSTRNDCDFTGKCFRDCSGDDNGIAWQVI
jgi:uracil DNA glycosylase